VINRRNATLFTKGLSENGLTVWSSGATQPFCENVWSNPLSTAWSSGSTLEAQRFVQSFLPYFNLMSATFNY